MAPSRSRANDAAPDAGVPSWRTHTNLQTIFEHHEVLGTWLDSRGTDRAVLYLLIPADQTEPVMDRLEQAFAALDGFRVVLLSTEAVAPRPKPIVIEAPVQPEIPAPTFGRVSREELFNGVSDSLDINRVFLGLACLSSIVATVGLLRDDVAVIIGAMVIAPLLGPNVAMALARPALRSRSARSSSSRSASSSRCARPDSPDASRPRLGPLRRDGRSRAQAFGERCRQRGPDDARVVPELGRNHFGFTVSSGRKCSCLLMAPPPMTGRL